MTEVRRGDSVSSRHSPTGKPIFSTTAWCSTPLCATTGSRHPMERSGIGVRGVESLPTTTHIPASGKKASPPSSASPSILTTRPHCVLPAGKAFDPRASSSFTKFTCGGRNILPDGQSRSQTRGDLVLRRGGGAIHPALPLGQGDMTFFQSFASDYIGDRLVRTKTFGKPARTRFEYVLTTSAKWTSMAWKRSCNGNPGKM